MKTNPKKNLMGCNFFTLTSNILLFPLITLVSSYLQCFLPILCCVPNYYGFHTVEWLIIESNLGFCKFPPVFFYQNKETSAGTDTLMLSAYQSPYHTYLRDHGPRSILLWTICTFSDFKCEKPCTFAAEFWITNLILD